jgi:regulatory protein
MIRWQVPSEERHKVLQRLIEERFIDDRRYAEAFVREKINLSAWGEYKIKAALRNKGISDQVITSIMADNDSLLNEERLRERLTRKLRSLKADTPYQLKTKLIRHGLSLGFPTDFVIECVEKLMNDLNINSECDLD